MNWTGFRLDASNWYVFKLQFPFISYSYLIFSSATERSDKGLLAVLKISSIALASYSVFCASLSLGFLQATLEPHLRQFNLSPLTMGELIKIISNSSDIQVWLLGDFQ